MEGPLMAVIGSGGQLLRTMPCPMPIGERHRLRGARRAAILPPPGGGPVTVPHPLPGHTSVDLLKCCSAMRNRRQRLAPCAAKIRPVWLDTQAGPVVGQLSSRS
jgi:hypothetical protein